MTLARSRPISPVPHFIVPERSDEQIGRELRRLRKDKFGDRGSLAKVAKDADVSIALVGAIERGDHSLSKVGQERITRLAQAYGMTNEQFADLTGISIVSPQNRQITGNLAITANTNTPLPDSLLEAAKLYGGRFPDLHQPAWQAYLSSFKPRGARADSPEEWLDLYRDLAKHGITPGGN